MTRTEYMEKLQDALGEFDPELRDEIMEDYRQHFAEGGRLGRADEELIEELGSIEDMVQELRGEYEAKSVPSEAASDPKKGEAGSEWQGEESSYYPEWECKSVVLDCKSADIITGRSEDEKIHISYRGCTSDRMRYDFYQYEKNGVLYAGQREKHGFSFSFGNFRTVLDIKVPEGLQMFTASTTSGDVILSELAIDKGHITSKSGDIRISRSSLSAVVLSSNSGDLELEASTVASGELSSLSGDISVHVATVASAQFSTHSGDLEVDAPTFAAGRLSSLSGDICVKSGSSGALECKTSSGDIGVEGTEIKTGVFSSNSGDINVKAPGSPQNIALHTTSGDIRLTLEGAEGMEATVKCRTGDTSVKYKDQKKNRVKNETLVYGDGSCKVAAEAVSGDICVCCK